MTKNSKIVIESNKQISNLVDFFNDLERRDEQYRYTKRNTEDFKTILYKLVSALSQEMECLNGTRYSLGESEEAKTGNYRLIFKVNGSDFFPNLKESKASEEELFKIISFYNKYYIGSDIKVFSNYTVGIHQKLSSFVKSVGIDYSSESIKRQLVVDKSPYSDTLFLNENIA